MGVVRKNIQQPVCEIPFIVVLENILHYIHHRLITYTYNGIIYNQFKCIYLSSVLYHWNVTLQMTPVQKKNNKYY